MVLTRFVSSRRSLSSLPFSSSARPDFLPCDLAGVGALPLLEMELVEEEEVLLLVPVPVPSPVEEVSTLVLTSQGTPGKGVWPFLAVFDSESAPPLTSLDPSLTAASVVIPRLIYLCSGPLCCWDLQHTFGLLLSGILQL